MSAFDDVKLYAVCICGPFIQNCDIGLKSSLEI